MVTVVTHNATAYMPLSELVDMAAELERIAKEKEKAAKRPADRGAEALQREVRLPGPGGGGQRRAGEGRQVPAS